MWHDAWPPLPPGGHRPPDAPPFTSPGDQLLAVGLGAAAGAGALVWATGQAAGLVFGHTWLELSPADVAHVLWHLPQHWSDPALAWPTEVRGPLPGPAGMYATFTGLVGGLSGGTAAVLRHLPGRAAGHRPGHPRPAKHAAAWAGGRELRLLTVGEPEPGRVILGRTPGVFGRLLAAEDCHSVLVFGPTGSYKTSALVIPAVLEWSGPLVATSVKPDLLRATMAHRARLGQVLVIDPLGASGRPGRPLDARWPPVRPGRAPSRPPSSWPTRSSRPPPRSSGPSIGSGRPWAPSSSPPCSIAAATKGLSMAEVLHWLDSREDQEVKDILAAAGVPAATDAWESSQYRTDRAVDSLYATAEEVLAVYGNERVSASTDGHDLDLDALPERRHTRSTCTPPPTSSGCSDRCSRRSPSRWWPPPRNRPPSLPTGCCHPRLGLFLDEAGNCAALSDLDVLATTARGQGIQLVTVWHDKSQLEARYGPKASTILNNHRAKLFLSGLADLSALELGARLIGDQALVDRNRSMGSDGRHSTQRVHRSYRPLLPVEDLRRLRPGEGVLLYGHLRPTPIRLRPFYEPREQARRERAEDRTARRVARTERRLGRKTERAFKRLQRRQDRAQTRKAAARVVWPERDGGRR